MPTAPSLVSLDSVRLAQRVIGDRLHRTPTVTSRTLGDRVGAQAWLKLELFQRTGSFKPRGAINALSSLSAADRAKGVISISAGNHAQALAWAANALGVRSTIVMPETAVPTKVEATRDYGGEVILTAADLLATCLQLQQERGLAFVHPFDDDRVIAGTGTVGLEIIEDVPATDLVVVPCGGGGLLSGVAAAVKRLRPHARIVGVEPVGANVMSQSLASGRVMKMSAMSTIADGLAAPFAGVRNLAHVQALVDQMVEVTDQEILDATRFLFQRAKVFVEPAGAAATAALLSGRISASPSQRVVAIVSGGNLDLGRLKALL